MQRQRDALQKQIDLFEQQKQQAQQSPSAHESPKLSRMSKPGSPSQHKPSVPQTVWDNVVHKRSASDELYRGPLTRDGFTPIPAEYNSNSLKEPLNMAQLRKSPVNAPPTGTREPTVPLHLLSKTNEQKMGSVASQHLPFKLAQGSSSSRSQSTSSLSQKLPFKLSSHSSQPAAVPPVASPPSSRATGKHTRWGDARTTVQSAPAAANPNSRLSGSQSQPHLGHNRVSSGVETHSMLPMKLAEKRQKSASPSPQSQLPPSGYHQHQHDQNRPRHSQKPGQEEPEVMYF